MSVNLENECKVSTSDSDCWGVFEEEDENSDHGGAGLDESLPLLSLPPLLFLLMPIWVP